MTYEENINKLLAWIDEHTQDDVYCKDANLIAKEGMRLRKESFIECWKVIRGWDDKEELECNCELIERGLIPSPEVTGMPNVEHPSNVLPVSPDNNYCQCDGCKFYRAEMEFNSPSNEQK